MGNEKLKNQLENFIEEYGATITFIAKKSKVNRSTLSSFINNKKDLNKRNAMKLEQFLITKMK